MTEFTRRMRKALPLWIGFIRKISARRKASFPKRNIRRKADPRSSSVLRLLRDVSSAPVIDLSRLLDAVIYNYLVGNNDAHGKNFSLLYHGVGTANQEIRLAPLYDVVSTVYYPELSNDMAMKIGGEYSSDKVTPKDFEQLAEEAGLGKPLVRRRVPELAETVIAALAKIEIAHPIAEKVAALIGNAARRH